MVLIAIALLAAAAIFLRDKVERRRHRRYVVDYQTTLVYQNREAHVVVKDIGRGGAKLKYLNHHNIRRGMRVRLLLEGEWVSGRVVWAHEGVAGIAFHAPIDIPEPIMKSAKSVLE